MEYLFVFKNGCWWLKITEPAQLFDYYEKTDSKWSAEFYNLITSKEFGTGEKHADKLAYAIGQYGANRGLNPIQATQDFRAKVLGNQLDALLEYGEIYINRNGGYHFKHNVEDVYKHWVRRKEFVYPDFKKDDIRISQFPGGEHWYAYIGDMQIKDGGVQKWDTYEEAYEKASKLITNV